MPIKPKINTKKMGKAHATKASFSIEFPYQESPDAP